MTFRGVHTDDVTGDEIPENEVVTLTIASANSGETKVVHVHSEVWDTILEQSEDLSAAIFTDD